MIKISDAYMKDMDADTLRVLTNFNEPLGSLIMEVGANESFLADILSDNGHRVMGVDLLPHKFYMHKPNYFRVQGDFVQMATHGLLPKVDCVVTTSAIEHFGLRTYEGCPGDELYDVRALQAIYSLLPVGGTCYLTVPYGREFFTHGRDWRVYDAAALESRLVRLFTVEDKQFFKSADCMCRTMENGDVAQGDADSYDGRHMPHLTVYLKLRKE